MERVVSLNGLLEELWFLGKWIISMNCDFREWRESEGVLTCAEFL